MHGGLLIEQMLRIYFFERRELQNLCLIVKNSQNEMLLDTYSSKTLDSVLQFVVEATEVMAQNAHSLVRNFVYVLHSKVAQNTSDSLGHLSLIRFAKGL